jgi:hypothetical protein
LTGPDIVDPASVRYAWEYYPEDCNLYNGDGLPAAPFRTDKWGCQKVINPAGKVFLERLP